MLECFVCELAPKSDSSSLLHSFVPAHMLPVGKSAELVGPSDSTGKMSFKKKNHCSRYMHGEAMLVSRMRSEQFPVPWSSWES